MGAAPLGLQSIYQPGFKYAKAGVMLQDLQSDSVVQQKLDPEGDADRDWARLMTALDTINQRFDKGALAVASIELQGDRRVWAMRQERRTQGYTTRREDMPVARA